MGVLERSELVLLGWNWRSYSVLLVVRFVMEKASIKFVLVIGILES